MTPFDRLHTSSYSFSIVTMAVSCIVSELKRDIDRKTPIFHKKEKKPLPVYLYDPLETSRISFQNNANCPSPRAIRRCKTIAETFNPLRRVHQRYIQTGRQTTERQTTNRQTDGQICDDIRRT